MELNTTKKIILSAGGTGGHLFPAQALAQTLSETHPECEILFVAGGLSKCRYFDRSRFHFVEIDASSFPLKNPFKLARSLFKNWEGLIHSRKIIKEFAPDLVVGFGSFLTLPVLLGALSLKVPFVLHEQNAIPGKVNRLFSRFAVKTAITFPESARYLRGKVEQVAFPLRKKSPAINFGLEKGKPTLLVFGGSQGAHRLNQLVLESAPHLKQFQIFHFTGTEERAREAIQCYTDLGIKHYVRAFEPHIDRAMECADVVISRAGASSVSELIEMERPAILIPFPFASENHQVKNAEHFTQSIGGGCMLLEHSLNGTHLAQVIQKLYTEECAHLKKNIQIYKSTRNLKHLSEWIMDL